MKYVENCGVTKKDINRGFTDGRGPTMIIEESLEPWEIRYSNREEEIKGGFLGRGRTWER